MLSIFATAPALQLAPSARCVTVPQSLRAPAPVAMSWENPQAGMKWENGQAGDDLIQGTMGVERSHKRPGRSIKSAGQRAKLHGQIAPTGDATREAAPMDETLANAQDSDALIQGTTGVEWSHKRPGYVVKSVEAWRLVRQ